MTYSFNLIVKPWIPCLRLDGTLVEHGLRDTLVQAHRLREIRGDTPLETAALHRLLLAILHRVFGPKDRSTWLRLWRNRNQGFDLGQLESYWQQWYPKFDLFDEHYPFFQVADESQLGDRDTVNKMITRLTPDETLFEHTLNDEDRGALLTFAQAARALVAIQYYGLGYKQFVDAPCAKGIVFLVQGQTLMETLLLNLVRYPEDSGDYASTPDDVPVWERESPFVAFVDGSPMSRDAVVEIRDGKQQLHYEKHQPLGQLDYLTWPNRKIKLLPETVDGHDVVRKIAWAPGSRLDDSVTDPMQYYTKGKSGWQPLVPRLERALWRDLDTLLRLTGLGSETRPIASVHWLARLAQSEPELQRRLLLLSAFGMAKDQAKLIYLRQETTPLPVVLLEDEHRVSDLSTALDRAEKAAQALERATFVLAWLVLHPATPDTELDTSQKAAAKTNNSRNPRSEDEDKIAAKMKNGRNPRSKDKDAQAIYKLQSSWGAERYFWSDLEPHFHRLITDLPDRPEQALQTWIAEVRRAARAAFDQAASYVTGDRRSLRAIAIANEQFDNALVTALRQTDATQAQESEGGENT